MNTYKWSGQTWRRWESGEGREGRRSGEMKKGSPLRVERRRQGVSIGCGKLPNWTTPALALPLLHAFTTNFMLSLSLSLSLVLEGDNKVLFFFGESCGRKTLGFAPKIKPFVLFCSVLFVWNFEQALKPYRNLKLRAIILGGLNPSPILLLIFPRLGSQLGLL